ncbi:dipeptide/oligopeptide/nickel ABC transporter permease/ATP-binding protein [Nocardioides sp. GY 10127]|uniref:dipeptide/oligopeptide/nickel ABC transporter permease/ATP-binding protein n=1 Tax=Nocardioides sp. GY 10127 TaxID=2569762 RepID=UPI0010A94A2C|nr:dipeptide/oligopeptide/nickel ABC transporter permease/ATP-binding protein [Nocardioides sp. GY 10127]TIC80027.1 dipeptide/oligopeptide/nickel ABC transporter permease/ATP-binding protein [Nocardioides sp. GY 10127]
MADTTAGTSPVKKTVGARRVLALAKENAGLIVGVALLVVFGAVALFAGVFAPYPADTTVGDLFGAPSAEHWLGLDDGGQDVFSQLLYGTQQSMLIGLAAALVSGVVGMVVGVTAGYFGGWVEGVLMRITDYVIVIPFIPLAIVVATIHGASLSATILIIGMLLWANTARVVRAPVLSLRHRLFVARARGMGAGHGRVLVRHILPQVLPLIISSSVLAIATAIFADTAMSFLGLGIPGGSSWGQMIDIAFRRGATTQGAWWAIVPPGLCVGVVVLACSLVGRHVERVLNPRLAVSYMNPGDFTVGPTPEPKPVATTGKHEADDAVLRVRDLDVVFSLPAGEEFHALHSVDLDIRRGRKLGIVGESGSGKTTLLMSLLGLSAPNATVSGRIELGGEDMLAGGAEGFRKHLWRDIAWIPQGAMNAFNPVRTMEWQLVEAVRRAGPVSSAEAKQRAGDLFERVGIPRSRLKRYPHEFSGGMKQRAAIAMALAARPTILLADEATTALDAMVQAQILELLESLAEEMGLTIVFVTHDLGLVGDFCDEAAVVYQGRIVEMGSVVDLYHRPQNDYTRELFNAAAWSRGADGSTAQDTDQDTAQGTAPEAEKAVQ